MKQTVTVYFREDAYEITFDVNLILRIIKYCGESQYPVEQKFEHLPEAVKHLIIVKITRTNQL